MKTSMILFALMLAGCEAVIPQATANMKAAKSQEDYRKCLQSNPGNAPACETQKALYEMDLRSYRATMGN